MPKKAAIPKRKTQLPIHKKRAPPKTTTTTTTATSTKKAALSGCTKEKLFAVIVQVTNLHGGQGAGAPRDIVAKRAGYPNAQHQAFTKAISRQTKNGFLTTDGDRLFLTDTGVEMAGNADVSDLPTDNETQLNKIEESLSTKQRELFVLLRDGEPKSKEMLAKTLDYPSSKVQAFTKLLSRVKVQGYLEDAPDVVNAVQLSDLCFPFGRA